MIIDGTSIAKEIELTLKQAIVTLSRRPPCLAFIRVGNDPSSLVYIRRKKKKCAEVGIASIDKEFTATVSEETLIQEIETLNANSEVDGILVQLPLPMHISPFKVMEQIDPKKDVDGFHPLNMGRLLLGEKNGLLPCTPYGIYVLLSRSSIDPAGKHVVILGRSNIVGKPLAALLMQKEKGANATVSIAHTHTQNLKSLCKEADILVAALGAPKFVTQDMVKKGAVVIDVGISSYDHKIVGDVDFEQVAPKCSYITPVPGGVGPMTIAMLLSNTLLSYQRRMG